MHTTHPKAAAALPAAGKRRGSILRRVQVACQGKKTGLAELAPPLQALERGAPRRQAVLAAFTLVEMLTVIVIIAILASALTVSLTKARSLARQADCKSSMRQLGAAVLIYRSDHSGSNPPWLSRLYPDYVDDLHLFVCRSDPSHGTGRTRAADLTPSDSPKQQFPEIIDNAYGTANGWRKALVPGTANDANLNVSACSYSYEFAAAPSSWVVAGSGASEKAITWDANKQYQLLYGDAASSNQPYSSSRMPMIRCYHHYSEGHINAHPPDGTYHVLPQIQPFAITINVAYAGNVYVGPLWWEGALKPGEQ